MSDTTCMVYSNLLFPPGKGDIRVLGGARYHQARCPARFVIECLANSNYHSIMQCALWCGTRLPSSPTHRGSRLPHRCDSVTVGGNTTHTHAHTHTANQCRARTWRHWYGLILAVGTIEPALTQVHYAPIEMWIS